MLLTETQFQSTFGDKMVDVTESAEPVVDIWPYVGRLVSGSPFLDYTARNKLVDKVYRNKFGMYDHVILPRSQQGVVCVIVVDIKGTAVYGHYFLNMNQLYGLS